MGPIVIVETTKCVIWDLWLPNVAKIMETIQKIALEMQLCKVIVTSINLNLR